jgi:nucleotide-binding universal stress UspA family protein
MQELRSPPGRTTITSCFKGAKLAHTLYLLEDMQNIRPQILVAFDFSDTAELALQHAINMAAEPEERDFHFLVALDPSKGIGLKKNETINFQYAEEVQKLATKHIEGAYERMNRGGELSMLVHVRIGEPVPEILALADEIGASLILIGSHGRTGVKRLLLGSVSERVVREALCPVLVTRDRTYQDVTRSKVFEVPKTTDEYVPPHRYHYNSGAPTRPKAWALY